MQEDGAYYEIQNALEELDLSVFVSLVEIKEKHRELAKKYHPDVCGDDGERFAKIEAAYKLLKGYIENYRFEFSEDEIRKQSPWDDYKKRFKF